MFKFGFSEVHEASEGESLLNDELIQSEEVSITDASEHDTKDVCQMNLGSHSIVYLKRNVVQERLSQGPQVDNNIVKAEQRNSDILPGLYEGGLKIWECTMDLLTIMLQEGNAEMFKGKRVLDLGCGAGLLGIMALKLGASAVHFQDFNQGVLQQWTIPNVSLSSEEVDSKVKFWSGDWSSFKKVNQHVYDVILSSETIYNPSYYSKLYSLLKEKMVENGQILLGAKCYYFGVGGSVAQFQDFCLKDGYFSTEILWTSESGVKRQIVRLLKKKT